MTFRWNLWKTLKVHTIVILYNKAIAIKKKHTMVISSSQTIETKSHNSGRYGTTENVNAKRLMLFTSRLIACWGLASHSFWTAALRSMRFCGTELQAFPRWPSLYHRFSKWFRSGDRAGHFIYPSLKHVFPNDVTLIVSIKIKLSLVVYVETHWLD